MDVKTFVEEVNRIGIDKVGHKKLCIPCDFGFDTLGGTQCVQVEQFYSGFDWDNDKLLLVPSKKLELKKEDPHKLNNLEFSIVSQQYDQRAHREKIFEEQVLRCASKYSIEITKEALHLDHASYFKANCSARDISKLQDIEGVKLR
jgi:hypothetical protein